MNKIPVVDLQAQYQTIKLEIDEAISRVVRSGRYCQGEEVRAFEIELAAYLGAQHVVAVGNATDALFFALTAKGVREGDKVITTPLTFSATSEAIVRCGARPIFVDIDRDFNMGMRGLGDSDILLPVHLYGLPCGFLTHLKTSSYRIIEDCAQSMGAKIPIADVSCYSFFPSKILGCYGDGGAIATNDSGVAEKIRMLRDHGRKNKYEHQIVGYNSRLDEIQAAILRVKLRHLDNWVGRRRELATRYLFGLDDLVETHFLEVPMPSRTHVFNYYTIRVRNGQRTRLIAELENKGIETVICYPIPLHLQPAYSFLGYKNGDFPEAERACEEVLCLPMYPELQESQVDYICACARGFFNG